jgi:hypothetical protein
MRIGETLPEVGTIFDWDIEEILSRPSGDLTWFIEDYANPEDHPECFDEDGEILDISIQENLAILWEACLDRKRNAEHYVDVFASIQENGFIRPLTAYVRHPSQWSYDAGQPPYLRFGDGHHRLAAAIELGMTTVPVMVCPKFTVQPDSHEWRYGNPVDPEIKDRSCLSL